MKKVKINKRLGEMKLFKFILILISLSVNKAIALDTKLEVILKVEQKHKLLPNLLLAIAKHESKLNPYALNIAGTPIFPKTKEEALSLIYQSLSKGIANIDIGISQINYFYHSQNFENVEQMLDLNINLEYAAKFLRSLYETHGSWNEALRRYHSNDPVKHNQYARKVLWEWVQS